MGNLPIIDRKIELPGFDELVSDVLAGEDITLDYLKKYSTKELNTLLESFQDANVRFTVAEYKKIVQRIRDILFYRRVRAWMHTNPIILAHYTDEDKVEFMRTIIAIKQGSSYDVNPRFSARMLTRAMLKIMAIEFE